jgi:hypothetical protein
VSAAAKAAGLLLAFSRCALSEVISRGIGGGFGPPFIKVVAFGLAHRKNKCSRQTTSRFIAIPANESRKLFEPKCEPR